MRRRICGAVFSLLALVCACIQPAWAQSADGPAPAARSNFEYRLGAGDKLRVIVYGEDALTGEFFVSGTGKIAFPLVGDIDALGKTIPELQQAIQAKLADGYIKEPKVSAEVLNYRPFYILGEVMKPGEYPYTNGLTVLNAVATASGFTYRADTRKVFIRRATNTGEIAEPLTPTTPVEPGDTIRIGERFF
jgi:polysaccharide export outer membrane protein